MDERSSGRDGVSAGGQALGVALVVLVTLLGFSGLAAWRVHAAGEEVGRQRFVALADRSVRHMADRFEAFVALLHGGSALFALTDRIDRDALRGWVGRLDLAEDYPAVFGVGYSARLRPDEVPALEARVHAEGLPDFRVWPLDPMATEVHTILYIEPLWQNRDALGYDMHAEPARAAAMDYARDSGGLGLTSPLVLVQEPDADAPRGFLLYVPVYSGDLPRDATVEQRRAALRGYVYAPLRSARMMRRVFSELAEYPVSVRITDGDKALPVVGDAGQGGLAYTQHLGLYGRTWTFEFEADKAAFLAPVDSATPIVAAGGLVSVAVSLAAWLVMRSRAGLTVALGEVSRSRAALADRSQELRAREAALRGVLEAVPQVVWTADEGGSVDRVNGRWEEVTGRAQEGAMGRGWLDAVVAEDRERVAATWAEAVRTGAPVAEDCRLETLRGPRWALLQARRADAPQGRIWCVSCTDIHDARLAEEHAREAQRLESIGLIASGVAHDFNNLLTAVSGFAGLARRRVGAEHPAAPLLDQVAAAVRRAADLTRQLSAYAGKGQLLTRRVELDAHVREMASLLRVSVPRQVELRLDLAPGVLVDADPGQLQQVVLNLVLNAAEAIGERPGHVVLAVGRRHLGADDLAVLRHDWPCAPGGYATLEVVDDGEGMTEETRARVFEPFFTTRFAGRGLGLAAVYGIVRSYRGAIRIASTRGQGTTVQVFLPLAVRRVPTPSPSPGGALGPTSRVLVVDDEPSLCEIARIALEEAGHQVIAVQSGEVALARAEADPPDLAIVDLTMPGLPGVDVIAGLRRARPEMAVLVMTGHGEEEALRQLGGLRVDAVLAKPFPYEALQDAVARVLRARAKAPA